MGRSSEMRAFAEGADRNTGAVYQDRNMVVNRVNLLVDMVIAQFS